VSHRCVLLSEPDCAFDAAKTQSRQVKSKDEIYQPIMIIGCAIENAMRRAIPHKRTKFEIMAQPSDIALTAMTLTLL
jgi:hypothetical protein